MINDSITIIDSALPTSVELKDYLTENKLLNNSKTSGKLIIYITDKTMKARTLPFTFFGKDSAHISMLDTTL